MTTFKTGRSVEFDGRVTAVDTSWDGRGTDVAVDAADVVSVIPGDAETLTVVTVRDGAVVVTGRAAAAEHRRINGIVHGYGPDGRYCGSQSAAAAAWAAYVA